MLLLRLAWRNVWRNTRRSLITISAIAFGLTFLIFLWGFGDGAHEQMVENFIRLRIGHFQLHAHGYLKEEDITLGISKWQELVDKLSRHPLVEGVTPRILGQGLIIGPRQSSGVILSGILPEMEKKVTNLSTFVTRGQFAPNEKVREILIGEDLARYLKVESGDKVVILSQGFYSSLESGSYRIRGIFRSGAPDIDRGLIFMNLHTLSDLLQMPDEVHEIAVRLRSSADLQGVIADEAGGDNLEINTWQNLAPLVVQWIELDNIVLYIIMFVVTIIVTIGITNSILMTVYERFEEFGVIRAMGARRMEILQMVLLEALLLSIVGVIAGVLLGLGLDGFYGWKGIDLAKYSTAFAPFYSGTVIYNHVTWWHVVQSAAITLAAGLVSSIYPAIHAIRIQPLEALRYV
ncbi:MAG: ABC transporter permease [Nitrospinae bacterium]|nr:ABC transporter permease [Nitrospinota bacterium]